MKKILIVEDDPDLSRNIKEAFTEEKIETEVAYDGLIAEKFLRKGNYDCIILDINLPGKNGYDICADFRKYNTTTPVLMLTAFDELEDKVQGFNSGTDDYLTKPFSPKELLARIRAVLRRKAPEALDAAVEVHGLRLDPSTRRVTRRVDGETREVKIGPTEFRLLHFFMTHPERVHSRAQLLDRVWGDHVFIEERTVDVHVKRLREALERVQCARMIETVRGAGYRLTQHSSALSA